MTKHAELNEKLRDISDFINRSQLERGYSPSVREICDEFNIKSTASVHYYFKKMEEYGFIRKDKQKSRAIEVIRNQGSVIHRDVVNIPLVGRIHAGLPHYAAEEEHENFPFPSKLFSSNDELFMLEVKGESMIEAGIYEGDYVVVRRQQTAKDNDIVVALIGNESATVKRFFRDRKYIRLHPENKYMKDQIYTAELEILGVVVGLIRTNVN